MKNAIQSLSNVILMLRDTETKYSSILDLLDRAVKDQGYEYEQKPKKRDYSWEDINDALSVLAENRNEFPEEWLESIDSLLLASQDELGFGRAKYPAPNDNKDPNYEEKPKKEQRAMCDKCGKDHAPGECPMDQQGYEAPAPKSKKRSIYSISDIRNKIRSRGRELILEDNDALARVFSNALSGLKTLKDSALFVENMDDMNGLEELGHFYTFTTFPEQVQEYLRVKEPDNIVEDVNVRSAERINALENFVQSVTSVLNDSTMGRSAKFGGIQAALNGFAEAVPDLVEATTPATERDMVNRIEEMVKHYLPGAVETAMRTTTASPNADTITPRRISLSPKPWTPPKSGTEGLNPRSIAEFTTKFRGES